MLMGDCVVPEAVTKFSYFPLLSARVRYGVWVPEFSHVVTGQSRLSYHVSPPLCQD